MLIYEFECLDCGTDLAQEESGDVKCSCGKTLSWKRVSPKTESRAPMGEAPMCFSSSRSGMKGFFTEQVGSGARGLRTADQQEAIHSADLHEAKKQARAAARENKGKLGKNGSMRQIGMIPAEMFFAAQRSTGNKQVWQDEGKKLLKKTGTYLLGD